MGLFERALPEKDDIVEFEDPETGDFVQGRCLGIEKGQGLKGIQADLSDGISFNFETCYDRP